MFQHLTAIIRQVIGKLMPYKDIKSAVKTDSVISSEMENAMELWYQMYKNKPPWLGRKKKSLNLPVLICREMARQILLEVKWTISAGKDADGEYISNPRTEFIAKEFGKVMRELPHNLEQGLASGGLVVKPYVKDKQICFDWVTEWEYLPIAYSDDRQLTDVVLRDVYVNGNTYYTRLERHREQNGMIIITQRAFKSFSENYIGTEVPLSEVPQWAELRPKTVIENTDGQLFGLFQTACANNIDLNSPMGVSIYGAAADTIKEADKQYGRLLWEYKGGTMRVFADVTTIKEKNKLPDPEDSLFWGVNAEKQEDFFQEHAPALRDASYIEGLNQILMRIEDQIGLSRGTLSDVNVDSRTATELIINKQRSYSTTKSNQDTLECCLRNVIRVIDIYATLYDLAPEGNYEVSFEWDDSIIVDKEQQLNKWLTMHNAGAMGLVELRMRLFGETEKQARQKVQQAMDEKKDMMASLSPNSVGMDEL